MPSAVTLHSLDTANIDAVKELMTGCDAFIHTSGLHGAHLKTHSFADFLDINVTQVSRLLLAAHSVGISRICLSSTLQVQCGYTQRASGSMIIEESMPSRADTPYSISKRTMEILGEEMARVYGLSIVSLRLGAFGYLKDAALGQKLLNLSITSTDAARATYHAIERTGFSGEAVLIAPSVPFSQADVNEGTISPETVVERHYPGAVEVLKNEGLAVASSNFYSVCSIRRAKVLMDWEPNFTFEDWLKLKGWKRPK